MNFFSRFILPVIYLWIAGTLFILFVLGYIFYGILWTFRFMQTRQKTFLFYLLAIMLAGAGIFYTFFFPLHRSHETVTIVVPAGASVRTIADSLHRHAIIHSRLALRLWLRASGAHRLIQAGKYSFVTNSSVFAAARSLRSAAPVEKAATVPEGLTIEQTAACLNRAFGVDTVEFIRLCRDSAFIATLLSGGMSSLEGYLFPDTYRFLETAGPAEMVRRMVGRFNEEFAKIGHVPTSPLQPRLSGREVVTLASIVEKEAMLSSERPRIAGVFYNRLRLGCPLGADPTVRYILKKFDGPLYQSELNTGSPYNTRRFKGLPPGPICSPGMASLQAVVSPMVTNELYFVAKWDGSGAHEFSITNEEHARKKMLIRQQNEIRLRQKEDSCRSQERL